MFLAQHVAEIPPQQLAGVDLQEVFGRLVDRGHHAVLIDRYDAGSNVAQHDLHILPALFDLLVDAGQLLVRGVERLLLAVQVKGHAVERLDEHADLIGRIGFDPDIEIAVRHGARCVHQVLHRLGHAVGQIDAHPVGKKHDDRGNQEQCGDIAGPDRISHDLELAELMIGIADLLHLVDQRIGNVIIDNHNADHVNLVPG